MSKNSPLVSIIIPIYNAVPYIAETLESAIGQTYKNIEIIAIEDGSPESSEEIVKKYPSVNYQYLPNQGNSTTRNLGIKMAKGKYISFLDCDDMYAKDKTELQVAYLESHPSAMIASGLTHEFNHPGTETPHWMREVGKRNDHRGSPPGTWLVRREAFEVVGMFDQTYKSMSDTDWLLRAKRKGIEMEFVEKIVLYKRNHDSNQSGFETPEKLARYHYELIQVFRNRHENS